MHTLYLYISFALTVVERKQNKNGKANIDFNVVTKMAYILLIPFHNCIIFSFVNCFLVPGTNVFLTWVDHTLLFMEWHKRFRDNRLMNTSADVLKLRILPVHVKCWILLQPVLEDMYSNLHFSVPNMNRLNQTEPATFSILTYWVFFRDLFFSISLHNEK
jgi:hypothetical protein